MQYLPMDFLIGKILKSIDKYFTNEITNGKGPSVIHASVFF